MLIVEMFWNSKIDPNIYDMDENHHFFISRTLTPEEAGSDFRSLDCSHFFWLDLLELGVEFGWKQTGTIVLIEDPKTGRRLMNDFIVRDYQPWSDWSNVKFVTERDAFAWAEALERALIAIEKGERKLPLHKGPMLFSELMSSTSVNLVNSSISIGFIQKFIDFLKKGCFSFAYDD